MGSWTGIETSYLPMSMVIPPIPSPSHSPNGALLCEPTHVRSGIDGEMLGGRCSHARVGLLTSNEKAVDEHTTHRAQHRGAMRCAPRGYGFMLHGNERGNISGYCLLLPPLSAPKPILM